MYTVKHYNKNGFTSIFLAVYMVILTGVLMSALFMAVNLATVVARQQRNSIQNYYYLERAMKYAEWCYKKYSSWPGGFSADPTVTIDHLSVGNNVNLTASVNGKTLKATYNTDLKCFTSWGKHA